MDLISGIQSTNGALNAQRTRLDIIAQNIANAQTTRGPDGLPYTRKVVSFESEMLRSQGAAGFGGSTGLSTVRVGGINNDPTPGQRVNDPGHPDADSEGMVAMPNVNLAFEMVDLITASRAYEANLSVAKNSRMMAMKTMEIGK
jgi:flagellar basal-body rod protein FlgC